MLSKQTCWERVKPIILGQQLSEIGWLVLSTAVFWCLLIDQYPLGLGEPSCEQSVLVATP